ncbi:MAG: hypothetical protein K8R25_12550 [Methanosarcinales archaeon]|nr:hypothetical protein [Methanosarcinales archaeon]
MLNTEGDRQSHMIVPGSPHDDLVGEEYCAGQNYDGVDDFRTPEHGHGTPYHVIHRFAVGRFYKIRPQHPASSLKGCVNTAQFDLTYGLLRFFQYLNDTEINMSSNGWWPGPYLQELRKILESGSCPLISDNI